MSVTIDFSYVTSPRLRYAVIVRWLMSSLESLDDSSAPGHLLSPLGVVLAGPPDVSVLRWTHSHCDYSSAVGQASIRAAPMRSLTADTVMAKLTNFPDCKSP